MLRINVGYDRKRHLQRVRSLPQQLREIIALRLNSLMFLDLLTAAVDPCGFSSMVERRLA